MTCRYATTHRLCSVLLSLILFGTFAVPVQAQSALDLPAPGMPVFGSPVSSPVLLKGMRISSDNSLQLDFIVDTGQQHLEGEDLRAEADRMLQYFLTSLTVPEDEMWVNLSPYEADRMIARGLGQTEMGRDLLAQDYLLKQFTASLFHPDYEPGRRFWSRIRQVLEETYGTSDLPVDTFHKVWIVPEHAAVFVHDRNVWVTDSRLKVLLEQDYLAMETHADTGSAKNRQGSDLRKSAIRELAAEIIRQDILPEIEREVNEGRDFAALRQIFHAMILAVWYKQNIHHGVLAERFVDQNKTDGIQNGARGESAEIYQRYVTAFRQGVFRFIREERNPAVTEVVPRLYFSGGVQGIEQVDAAGLERRSLPQMMNHIFRRFAGGVVLMTALFGPPGLAAPLVRGVAGEAARPPVEYQQENPLRWSDGNVMLGEHEPGVAYSKDADRSYQKLLKEDARRIAAAGFKVVKVYVSQIDDMRELELVAKGIYRNHGLKTLAVFVPPVSRSHYERNDPALNQVIDAFVTHLARYPWAGIQLGNEENLYLAGDGALAGDEWRIPMAREAYYQYYDMLAGLIKDKLPDSEKGKPVLLGQGAPVGFDQIDWLHDVQKNFRLIEAMKHIDGVAVNLYLNSPEMYDHAVSYWSQRFGKPLVIGEFGRSRHRSGYADQHRFNRDVWTVLTHQMRENRLGGAVVFAWNDKKEPAAGTTAAYADYDRTFGIRNPLSEQDGPYYGRSRAGEAGALLPAQYSLRDDVFWQAAGNPGINAGYFSWYAAQKMTDAKAQQNEKTAVLKQARQDGRILSDGDIQQWHDLNFAGAALYYQAVTALYNEDWPRLKVLYNTFYQNCSGAEVYYGEGSFWSPFEKLREEIRVVERTVVNDDTKHFLGELLKNSPWSVQEHVRKRPRDTIRSPEKEGTDQAQSVLPQGRESAPGGIDLNAGLLDLDADGSAGDFSVFSEGEESGIGSVEGLAPLIIQMIPVNNFPLLFGETSDQSSEQPVS